MPLPQSRVLRISLGVVLLICGVFGFFPVVGYWMIPLGLLVLSVDIPAVRRGRRKLEVKWGRWRQRRGEANAVSATVAFNGVSSGLP